MDVEGRVSGMTPFHNVNCPLVRTLPDKLPGNTRKQSPTQMAAYYALTDWLCHPQGFVTACMGDNGEETVKICQLPMRTRLDTPWPLQKIALRGTPHRLAYYAEARLYVLLVSRQVLQWDVWHAHKIKRSF